VGLASRLRGGRVVELEAPRAAFPQQSPAVPEGRAAAASLSPRDAALDLGACLRAGGLFHRKA